MNLQALLKKPLTNDSELKGLAKKIGLPAIEINWLSDVNDDPNILQIINLGSMLLGGTHFVATYGDHYFDPLGMPPPAVSYLDDKQFTNLNIQRSSQGHCGQWCVLWLYYAYRDELPEFYSMFEAYNIT